MALGVFLLTLFALKPGTLSLFREMVSCSLRALEFWGGKPIKDGTVLESSRPLELSLEVGNLENANHDSNSILALKGKTSTLAFA